MSGNPLGHLGGTPLALALEEDVPLTALRVARAGLGPLDADAFGRALALNTQLETLVLSYNPLKRSYQFFLGLQANKSLTDRN